MMTHLEREMNRQLVKYAVQRQMFCQSRGCGGSILDMRRAVLVTVKEPSGNEQSVILCGSCWDGSKARVAEIAAEKSATLEALDGRELFAKAPRKAAAPAAAATRRKSPLDLDAVMAAAEAGDGTGFCRACGNEQGECEPDARRRVCEACGKPQVYGAEELLIMGAL